MTIGSIVAVPGVRPVVELGVGNTNATTGQAVWDTARWDTAGDKWAGNEPTWLDITCDVHDVEIDAGRDRQHRPLAGRHRVDHVGQHGRPLRPGGGPCLPCCPVDPSGPSGPRRGRVG